MPPLARGRCRSTRPPASVRQRRPRRVLFNLQTFGNVYCGLSNPTVAALEEARGALEGGRAAVAAASGMAAEAMALMTLLQAGRPCRRRRALYGGTVTMLAVNLKKFGVETTFVDATPGGVRRRDPPQHARRFAETIGNPSLPGATDIAAVAEVAHAHGIPLVIVDNTVPSPLLPADPPRRRHRRALGHLVPGGHGTTLAAAWVESGKFPWDNGSSLA